MWGTIPQWVTAAIALAAGIIAVYSILTQRDIARKRAAVDFFLKAEMDATTIAIYNDYRDAIDSINEPLAEFVKTENYRKVRAFLHLCGLVAVGIRQRVLDETVVREYWGDVMVRAFRKTEALIQYMRTMEHGTPDTLRSFEEIARKWEPLQKLAG